MARLEFNWEKLKPWLGAHKPYAMRKLAERTKGAISVHGIDKIRRDRHIPSTDALAAIASVIEVRAIDLIIEVKAKRKSA